MPRSARQPSEAGVPIAALRSLLAILWRERDLLDVLGDAYGSERRAIAAGEGSTTALRHRVDAVLQSLQSAELERAVVTKALAASLGVDEYPSLTRLIELCPPSWATILVEHRQALRAMAERVDHLARRSRFSVVDGSGVPPAVAACPTAALQRSLLDFLA